MAAKKNTEPRTITCQHCRYERPASDKHCHICGYPWDFAGEKKPPTKRKKRPEK